MPRTARGNNPQKSKSLQRKKASGKVKIRSRKPKVQKRPREETPQVETIQEKLHRFETERRGKKRKLSEESEVTKEDIEFFENVGSGFVSFVESNLDGQTNSRRSHKNDKKLALNEVKDWEHTRTNKSWMSEASTKLPVKDLSGTLVEARRVLPKNPPRLSEEEDQPESLSSSSSEKDSVHSDSLSSGEDDEMLKVKLFQKRQERLTSIKQQIATIANEILENPEKKLRRITELRKMCESDTDDFVKKLVLVSELNLFKDIIPGYKIRLLTEEEEKVKVSEAVSQIRAYESILLNCYQKYLEYLQAQLNNASSKDLSEASSPNSLYTVSVKCLATLLLHVPHFNFRSNIVEALIPIVNSHSPHAFKLVTQAFITLFKSPRNSDFSLECVKKIVSFVKAKSYSVRSELLDLFIHLPLTTELPEGTNIFEGYARKKKKSGGQEHVTRSQKKQMKIDKEVKKS
eukprot:TRINITY_DN2791_c0_g1_i8.p1 TRINITY_DN2791_c0_g1~~TRINITY_DN2791_c0_g1_i8.p1  ORF type:complete len:486 (+),score=112.55 TRINITY_DN2791_c0_g1_i8:79-1458(+)